MPEGTTTTLACPTCGAETTLVGVERNGVLIDACPRCRGVWLDRGELDKLIDLEASASDDFLDEIRGGSGSRDAGYDSQGSHGSKHGSKHGSSKRRKRSFLGDMLDFG